MNNAGSDALYNLKIHANHCVIGTAFWMLNVRGWWCVVNNIAVSFVNIAFRHIFDKMQCKIFSSSFQTACMMDYFLYHHIMFGLICFTSFYPDLICCNTVSTYNSNTDTTTAQYTSVYYGICCNDENLGKSFVTEKYNGALRIIFCPLNKSSNCTGYSPCLDILNRDPTSTSGYYNYTLSNGSDITVYCDMQGVNCDGEGGWTRIGYIDPNTTSECPPELQLVNNTEFGLCRQSTYGELNNFKYSSSNISYSQICGQARAYLINGHGHGFEYYWGAGLDSIYADGISITTGNNTKHIWTYAVDDKWECPCSIYSYNSYAPQFVAKDYYCTTSNYNSKPLWDKENCANYWIEGCCTSDKLPWFIRSLNESTSDDVEVRIFCNHGRLSIEKFEIFVR